MNKEYYVSEVEDKSSVEYSKKKIKEFKSNVSKLVKFEKDDYKKNEMKKGGTAKAAF